MSLSVHLTYELCCWCIYPFICGILVFRPIYFVVNPGAWEFLKLEIPSLSDFSVLLNVFKCVLHVIPINIFLYFQQICGCADLWCSDLFSLCLSYILATLLAPPVLLVVPEHKSYFKPQRKDHWRK